MLRRLYKRTVKVPGRGTQWSSRWCSTTATATASKLTSLHTPSSLSSTALSGNKGEIKVVGETRTAEGSVVGECLNPMQELVQMTRAPKRLDRHCARHVNITLRLILLASTQYKKAGQKSEWLCQRRREQLAQFNPVTGDRAAPEAEEGQHDKETDDDATVNPRQLPWGHVLVNLVNSYIKYEMDLEVQLEANTVPQRLRAKQWQDDVSPYRLDALERQYILHLLCDVIEKREVPLVIATRLLRRRWPRIMMDVSGTAHHRFVVKSIFAWTAEELQKNALTPVDARAVLDNSAFALKSSGSILVGKLAMVAIRDIRERDNPESLISLMWAVSSSGVHAPDLFWRQIFGRLVEINRAQKQGGLSSFAAESGNNPEMMNPLAFMDGNGAGGAEADKHLTTSTMAKVSAKTSSSSGRARQTGSHVFSGLTTRQIFRILAVLKKERWSGEAGEMHELADQALKNIVFEAEALVLSDADTRVDISKKVLAERLRSISDLSFQEFLTLLTIAGDLGVPFHISALRVSDILFVPLTRFLDQNQLLSLLLVVRQTRCYSPSLMTVLAEQIRRRGANAPYALPLAKAYLRAVSKEKSLMVQPAVAEFIQYFFGLCAAVADKVRLSEVSTLADIVYALYRCHAPDSSFGLKCKEIVDIFCEQADRLLQLQLASTAVASKLLELTIVMGMRDNAQRYTNTAALLQTRNAASALNDSRFAENMALLAEVDEARQDETGTHMEEDAPKEMQKTTAADSAQGSVISRWTALEEDELPVVPKAALHVYNELIYFFEKMAIVKGDITNTDIEKFKSTFEQTGVYNIFLGAYLMQQAHLSSPRTSTRSANQTAWGTLPVSIQRRVHKIVMVKMGTKDASSKKEFSAEELLHILGQVHCSPEKISKLLHLIEHSPLTLTKHQRDLWNFVKKLTDKFGNKSQQKQVNEFLRSALY